MKSQPMEPLATPTGRLLGRLGYAAVILVAVLMLVGWTAIAVRGAPAWSSQPERSNTGAVQFVLTPRDVSGGRFRVDLVVNTHSGNLADLDLSEAVELRVGERTLRPVAASKLRGHHARGQLEFDLAQVPDAFEIVIRGIRTMGDLTFRWP